MPELLATDRALDPSNALVWQKALVAADSVLAPPVDVTAPFAQWFDDPVGWANDVAGDRLWAGQRAILESVRDNRFTVVRKCRKSGGTHALAAGVGWFATTRRSIVVTMASKQETLKGTLWERLAEIKSRSTIILPGKLDTLQWKLGPRHFAIGLTASNEGTVRGFHAGARAPTNPDDDYEPEDLAKDLIGDAAKDLWLLVILDEAQTIPDPIIRAFMGSIQGPNVRFVLNANPLMSIEAEHELARACRRGARYHQIHISARPADDDVKAHEVFSHVPAWVMEPEWPEQMAADLGEDNPLYRSDVLGQFSSHALANQFVTLAILRQALEREKDWKFEADVKRRHIGWDVAFSESGDDNVATFWDSGMLIREEVWKEKDVHRSADRIIEWRDWFGIGKNPVPGHNIHVDASEGAGKTAAQYMRRLGVFVDAVDAGAAATYDWPNLCADMLFENQKAKLLWVFRRVLQEGYACIPERFERLWTQAQWYSWEFKARKGGTVLAVSESKEDLKRVHGRSPDNLESGYNAWNRSGAPGPIVRRIRVSAA